MFFFYYFLKEMPLEKNFQDNFGGSKIWDLERFLSQNAYIVNLKVI
jgi:hypothetical protein